MPTRDELETQRARIDQALAVYDRFPVDDPYPDGTVLKFKMELSGRAYNYAAIRINSNWYTTGREAHYARTWATFVAWLGSRLIGELVVMTRKDKADRKLVKARAAARVTAAVFNRGPAATPNFPVADPAVAKELYEDMRAVDAGISPGFPVNLHPCAERILRAAKAAVTNPDSSEAATFLMAVARFETTMQS